MQSIFCRRIFGLLIAACLLFTLFSPISSVKAISTFPLPTLYTIGGYAGDIKISGDKAYMMLGNKFTVYSLANPDQPAWLGTLVMPGYLGGLILRGSQAYLLGGGYLYIINISDPAQPALVNQVKVSDFSTFPMVFYEHYLYIASYKQTNCCRTAIHVYDVTDPVSPIQLNVFDSWVTSHQNFIVIGSYLYVDAFSSIFRYSLADPIHPNDFKFVLQKSLGSDNPFVLDGTTLYAPFPIDVSDPANPVIKDNPLPINWTEGIAITDAGILYSYQDLCDGRCPLRLYVWNTKVPGSVPVEIKTYTRINQMAAYQNRLYVTGGYGGGFTVIDTTDPSTLSVVAYVDAPGSQSQLINVNEKLYTYQPMGRRLHAFDISQPNAVQWLGSIPLDADLRDLAADGNVLAVLSGSGLKLIDTSSPDGLRITGSDSTASSAYRVLLYQNTAYLYAFSNATLLATLAVEDISDPANPHQINSLDNLPEVKNFGIYSHYLYLGTDHGIKVVDLADPHAPVIVNTFGLYSILDYPGTFVLVGHYLFNGLMLYDLTDPVNPLDCRAGYSPVISDPFYNLKIDGDIGYQVVEMPHDFTVYLLQMYNLADPTHPVLISQYRLGYNYQVFIQNGWVFDLRNGLTISPLPEIHQLFLPALSRY